MKMKVSVGSVEFTEENGTESQFDMVKEAFMEGTKPVMFNFNNGPVIIHPEYYKLHPITITKI